MYFSEAPFDTQNYGVCRVDCTFGIGAPLYSFPVVSNYLPGVSWNDETETLLGVYVPYTEKYSNRWHLTRSKIIMDNCTMGNTTSYNWKMFKILFTRMFPNDTKFDHNDPRVSAADNIDSLIRRVTVAWAATTDVLQLGEAWARNPTAPWKAIVPAASEEDWRTFENRVEQVFDVIHAGLVYKNGEARFGNASHWDEFHRWFTEVFIPAGMGLKVPVSDWSSVLRSTRTEPITLTVSDEYLDVLVHNPLLVISSVQQISSLTTSAGISVPRYKITFRAPSADDPADWKPLISSGVLQEGSPLVRALQDPTTCCAANKTQAIVKASIDYLAHWFFFNFTSQWSFEPNRVLLFSRLQYLVPIDPIAVPPWMAHTLLRSVGTQLLECSGLDSSILSGSLMNDAVYFVRLRSFPSNSRCWFSLILAIFHCVVIFAVPRDERADGSSLLDTARCDLESDHGRLLARG